jgi:glycosyltransferase involved in cell wall biosynthesis
MLNISVLILTYNEEIHIERCINNAKKIASSIYVVDSFSNDKTVEIAESLGAVVFQNKWENNYARQFNWGINQLPKNTEWVFRLDADEYLTDELIQEINQKLHSIDEKTSGISFERKMVFMDKMITRGMPKMDMLRLFRKNHGRCEDRWMDEHISLFEGEIVQFDNYFVDHNLNTIGWWITKHNGYSIREAIDLLNIELNFLDYDYQENKLSKEAESKRRKKIKYAKSPLFLRSFIYFIYRYFIKIGFIEGKEGFLWHFLQGWWYRTLVDAKIFEIKKYCGNDVNKIRNFIKKNYDIEI